MHRAQQVDRVVLAGHFPEDMLAVCMGSDRPAQAGKQGEDKGSELQDNASAQQAQGSHVTGLHIRAEINRPDSTTPARVLMLPENEGRSQP
jgi:hypothetical protein